MYAKGTSEHTAQKRTITSENQITHTFDTSPPSSSYNNDCLWSYIISELYSQCLEQLYSRITGFILNSCLTDKSNQIELTLMIQICYVTSLVTDTIINTD